MAAILISESLSPTCLVVPNNFMLMALANNKKISAEQIVGGHCVPGADTCRNPLLKQDGQHPIAWGGAQQSMMTGGGLADDNGPLPDFGQEFEDSLVVTWLKEQNKISNSKSTCATPTTFAGVATNKKQALLDLSTRSTNDARAVNCPYPAERLHLKTTISVGSSATPQLYRGWRTGTVQRSGRSCRFGKGRVGIGNPIKSMPQPCTEGSVATLRRRPDRVDAVG